MVGSGEYWRIVHTGLGPQPLSRDRRSPEGGISSDGLKPPPPLVSVDFTAYASAAGYCPTHSPAVVFPAALAR